MSDAKVLFLDRNFDPAPPGSEVRFSFACPKHRDRRCEGLLIRGKIDSRRPSWDWDGNRERPTFSPSINHESCWHGFLRAGRCVNTALQDEPEP